MRRAIGAAVMLTILGGPRSVFRSLEYTRAWGTDGRPAHGEPNPGVGLDGHGPRGRLPLPASRDGRTARARHAGVQSNFRAGSRGARGKCVREKR